MKSKLLSRFHRAFEFHNCYFCSKHNDIWTFLVCFVLFCEPPPLFKYDQTKCHYLLTHNKFLGHFFYTLSEGRWFNQYQFQKPYEIQKMFSVVEFQVDYTYRQNKVQRYAYFALSKGVRLDNSLTPKMYLLILGF